MRSLAKLLAMPAITAAALVTLAAEQPSTAVDTLLRTAVEQKQVPMVVATAADAKGVFFEHASGVNKDAIFSIASMTKPVTSAAVMQLVEAGRVKLDEPATTYLPELAKVRVLDGGTLRPPKTTMTVRQLLTHTSGFGYEFLNKDLLTLVAKKEIASVMAGGDGFLNAPLLFDPGTRWEYGISIDWLGRLVERVSGQSLEAYFRQHIFDPLGMSDSYFVVPAQKQSRLVPVYARAADGSWAPQPAPPAAPITFFSGGGGLFSTAADYVKFTRAIMAGGQLDGNRILSAPSITTMGSNQIGELMLRPMTSVIPQLASNTGTMPGQLEKFGLGFALNSKPIASGRAANALSWAGIFNTFFWIDREKQLTGVLLTQVSPFLDAAAAKLIDSFDRAIYLRHATGSR
jgi:CubicO group peptidase (beta-lactamase class C family)